MSSPSVLPPAEMEDGEKMELSSCKMISAGRRDRSRIHFCLLSVTFQLSVSNWVAAGDCRNLTVISAVPWENEAALQEIRNIFFSSCCCKR